MVRNVKSVFASVEACALHLSGLCSFSYFLTVIKSFLRLH